VRLGIRANLAQFSPLVGVNALVGGMIGQERTVLPLLAQRGFGLSAHRFFSIRAVIRGRTWRLLSSAG
jgi:hypothetical protein